MGFSQVASEKIEQRKICMKQIVCAKKYQSLLVLAIFLLTLSFTSQPVKAKHPKIIKILGAAAFSWMGYKFSEAHTDDFLLFYIRTELIWLEQHKTRSPKEFDKLVYAAYEEYKTEEKDDYQKRQKKMAYTGAATGFILAYIAFSLIS